MGVYPQNTSVYVKAIGSKVERACYFEQFEQFSALCNHEQKK